MEKKKDILGMKKRETDPHSRSQSFSSEEEKDHFSISDGSEEDEDLQIKQEDLIVRELCS